MDNFYLPSTGFNTGDAELDKALNESESYYEYAERVGMGRALPIMMWANNMIKTYRQLDAESRKERTAWLKAGCPKRK